jgi:hypothetical protein
MATWVGFVFDPEGKTMTSHIQHSVQTLKKLWAYLQETVIHPNKFVRTADVYT